ncbi:MAG: hypothetical protein QNJ75_12730 [Acidimicrobiia bacterium]|nr:hypothetical protein [Acidimicrobiia bacterium]MDJ0665409.1 hypothetical protein [Acidimicrobiia bacterium]
MKRTVVFAALVTTLFAACGDDASDEAAEPVSIADAIDTEGEVVVTGYLFVLDGDSVVLAELIAESFPPQPGGATITVEGLDLAALDLEEAPEGSELATTRWSSEPVSLTGSISSGVLTGAELG